MQISYHELESLKRAARNPKDHDLGALHESMQRFGFVMPLLLNTESGRLVAGHGRLDELLRGYQQGEAPPENIKLKRGKWMVPVIEGVSFKDEDEAEAYLLADNRLVEIGGWTQAELLPILKELAEREKLGGTGYTAEEVDVLLDTFSPSPDAAQGQLDTLKKNLVQCPKCSEVFDPGIYAHTID